ncbi:hypothetical protein E4U41_001690 [Claviceps citrina]|nr:hypothetical protein E4U41_001690 [Claviceps citrina]
MTTSMVSPSPAAQETLSVTTAIIGLLAVGGKTIETLWDLNTPAADRRSNAVFVQALQEIKQCRSTVHVLYRTLSLLELAQLPYPERATWIQADHLIAILTDTVLAMSDLQAICETLGLDKVDLATRPPSALKANDGSGVECASPHKKTMEALCSRIRWLNLSMTMMMTILKWYVSRKPFFTSLFISTNNTCSSSPGESDAQNSRVGLERRMTRLLSANTTLSTRMRQLDDVFDRGRPGRPESLPHYSLPARHARLSLPPRLAPYPGTAAAMQLSAASADGGVTTADTAEFSGAVQRAQQPLSPLSGYTLADTPVLSMIPLPVITDELTDGTLSYTLSYALRVSRDLADLLQNQAGQGTSRSLGVILGRMNTGIGNAASSSSTGGSSSDSGPLTVATETTASGGAPDGKMKANKWKVRNLKVRRRWRA